ncbi:MAG: arginine--tRNA ligase, partial [Rhizobiaceae bacterium]
MNIFSQFEDYIKEFLQNIDSISESFIEMSRVSAEPPRDASHGDIATNAAMVLAKTAGEKPRDLAEKISAKLQDLDAVSEVSIAGPGFINIRLADKFWQDHLKSILELEGEYGRALVSDGVKVNVEYVSANPTGPMHVGHCRGAVVGDALANLLQFAGYDVTKEYYVNDAGVQINVLAESLFHRYREALGEDVGDVPEGLYPGKYLISPAKSLVDTQGKSLLEMDSDTRNEILKKHAISSMMDMIRAD